MKELLEDAQKIKSLEIQGASNIATKAIDFLSNYAKRLKCESIEACFKELYKAQVILIDTRPTEQAMKNGKGITWLDDCRIPHDNEKLGGGAENRTTFKDKEGWDRPWRHDKEKEAEHCQRIKDNVNIHL